jgi:hypothetical protein
VEVSKRWRHGVANDKDFREGSQPGFGEFQAHPDEIGHRAAEGFDETNLRAGARPEVADDSRNQVVRLAPVSMSRRIATGAGTSCPEDRKNRPRSAGAQTRAGRMR